MARAPLLANAGLYFADINFLMLSWLVLMALCGILLSIACSRFFSFLWQHLHAALLFTRLNSTNGRLPGFPTRALLQLIPLPWCSFLAVLIVCGRMGSSEGFVAVVAISFLRPLLQRLALPEFAFLHQWKSECAAGMRNKSRSATLDRHLQKIARNAMEGGILAMLDARPAIFSLVILGLRLFDSFAVFSSAVLSLSTGFALCYLLEMSTLFRRRITVAPRLVEAQIPYLLNARRLHDALCVQDLYGGIQGPSRAGGRTSLRRWSEKVLEPKHLLQRAHLFDMAILVTISICYTLG